jgi:hypothetical protein
MEGEWNYSKNSGQQTRNQCELWEKQKVVACGAAISSGIVCIHIAHDAEGFVLASEPCSASLEALLFIHLITKEIHKSFLDWFLSIAIACIIHDWLRISLRSNLTWFAAHDCREADERNLFRSPALVMKGKTERTTRFCWFYVSEKMVWVFFWAWR